MNYFDQEMHQSDIEDAQDAIKYCIQGIEDNNSLNGGETSDWENEFEVTNVYLLYALNIDIHKLQFMVYFIDK